MKGYDKYERGYFMPPECTYDWVKKEYIDKAPLWCSVDLRDGNQDCPTAFMIKIRKSVQNIIRHLMKSAVGNGQKCNYVMIRLMLLP